jgi:di/tricarboxylate transporter
MDKTGKIVVVVIIVLVFLWIMLDFFVLNKPEKPKSKELSADQRISPTSFMIVIIVLLLAFAIRQEIQMDDLKDQVSSMHSDLSSDIRDVKNAVYSTCN